MSPNLKPSTTPTLRRTIAGALLAVGAACGAHAATITISCGSTGADLQNCAPLAEEWAKAHGHTIKPYTAPAAASDYLALMRQQFAAKSADIDVMVIDITWPGVIKDHLLDLKKYTKGAEAKHFPAIVANNTIDGKLLGMPFFTDAGLLYYRKDLLAKYGGKVPATWEELAATAKKAMDGERAAGTGDFQGYVFQGKAYEGLTCNALEWVASFGGGQIIDDKGEITINNPNAAKALDAAASWIGTISPEGVLNYAEEDARGVFQNGKSMFMRNWPYAWSLTQAEGSAVKGKVGIAPLPAGAGGKPAATLGGWQLAVSKYSKSPDAAAELVMYLTSPEVQKKRAIGGSYNPTIPDLYKDKDVLAANPFMGDLLSVFTGAVARPATQTGLKYPEVSRAFWDTAHDVMSKRVQGPEAVKRLDAKLKGVKRKAW